MLHEAATYDFLDVSNISCIEVVLRKVQLIEYEYSQHPDYHAVGAGGKAAKGRGKKTVTSGGLGLLADQANAFSGISRARGTVMCCPALLEFVGEEMEKDSNVLKQLRKGREERALALKNRGSGKKDDD